MKSGTESSTFPTGTGPYAYSGEGGAHLAQNASWWQGKSLPLERIELTACKDTDSVSYAFYAREVQLLFCDLTGADDSSVYGSGDYTDAATTIMQYLCLNTRRELETRFDRDGIEPLLAELWQVDPESAARLHPADTKRILRALEVYLETGETISAHNAATRQLPPRYDAVWIGLQFADRADMKALIDRRVDKMAEEGLLEEVQALLAMGLPRNATAMQAIGYKEFLGVLDGTLTEQEALELVKLRSRQYAKRQLTWLRRNPAIHWIYWEKDRDFARALQISTEILTASGLG